MNAKFEELTDNELNELSQMMSEIAKKINGDFRHVRKFIPYPVSLELFNFFNDLNEEREKRIF